MQEKPRKPAKKTLIFNPTQRHEVAKNQVVSEYIEMNNP